MIVSPAAKITIRSATGTRARIKANTTLTKSESRKIQWLQWSKDRKARKEIRKTTSRDYSKDLALYILKESTRSSSALTFASPSSNVNWKKTKRKNLNKTMKMATKMELWDSSNPPTGST